eukprot:NODE_130_length_16779_cov_1.687410.p14 type:complete len:172 gc:universal NODE_130_length_16779_cov_1.687410:6718-7233(+)
MEEIICETIFESLQVPSKRNLNLFFPNKKPRLSNHMDLIEENCEKLKNANIRRLMNLRKKYIPKKTSPLHPFYVKPKSNLLNKAIGSTSNKTIMPSEKLKFYLRSKYFLDFQKWKRNEKIGTPLVYAFKECMQEEKWDILENLNNNNTLEDLITVLPEAGFEFDFKVDLLA